MECPRCYQFQFPSSIGSSTVRKVLPRSRTVRDSLFALSLFLCLGFGGASATFAGTIEIPPTEGYYGFGRLVHGPFPTEEQALAAALPEYVMTHYFPGLTVYNDYPVVVGKEPYTKNTNGYWLLNRIVRIKQLIRAVYDSGFYTENYNYSNNLVQLHYTCPAGFSFKENYFTWDVGQPGPTCVGESACPELSLKDIPSSDLCALSLEKGKGADVNNACPSMTDEMKREASCLTDKIRAVRPVIDYAGPSATIRNVTYQKHLSDIYSKWQAMKKLPDTKKQACSAEIAKITREMQEHGIDSKPSDDGEDAPHVKGRAIDIPRKVTDALIKQVTTSSGDVEDYVRSATVNPPACNLRWGGRFTPVDRVHFQLP